MVCDADLPPRVKDETVILELAHRDRQRRTLHADHLGQELLGDPERAFVDSIVDLEQPARRALIKPMDAIAQDQLRHRDHDDLRMSLEEPHERAAAHDFLAQRIRVHAHG